VGVPTKSSGIQPPATSTVSVNTHLKVPPYLGVVEVGVVAGLLVLAALVEFVGEAAMLCDVDVVAGFAVVLELEQPARIERQTSNARPTMMAFFTVFLLTLLFLQQSNFQGYYYGQ
jgi:uncharacterized membrane protein